MNKRVVEWYLKNKNRIMFGIFLIIIITIISLIVGFFARLERKEMTNNELIREETNNIGNFNYIYVEDSESVLTGEKITSSQINMLEVIEKFTEYCNNQKINEAYGLLSSECKEEVYPTLESFKDNYYNRIFNKHKRNISVEYWTDNIFKVKFEEDALSTGIYTDENTIQDYISVIRDQNYDSKLNINGYIGRKEINKTENNRSITAIVIRSDNYIDYQKYTYRITNNTSNTILLDDKNSTNNMYLEDKNGNEYTAYIHELSEKELLIDPGETKEVTIKYYNKYGTTKEITDIIFNKIILNYNETAKKQTISIRIDL